MIDVVWANPGAPHPKTLEYMRGVSEAVPSFIEIRGNQPDWIKQHGWPADVVPARLTTIGELGAGPPRIKLQPYFQCCGMNMWQPIHQYIERSGHTLVITGQRKEESMRNRMRDEKLQQVDGVEYFQPLNDWTELDVFRFIAESGHVMPPFYEAGATSSPDCWNCTAYLDHNESRLMAMKKYEPERWAAIQPVLQATAEAIRSESSSLERLVYCTQSKIN